jgi:heat shock protein HtpX
MLGDEGGVRLVIKPGHSASTLQKMHCGAERFPMHENPAPAHMFIGNPLRSDGGMWLFKTHPPMEERIERLRAM